MLTARRPSLISFVTSAIASSVVSQALSVSPIVVGFDEDGTHGENGSTETAAERSKRLKRERDRRYREAKKLKAAKLEAVTA